MLKLTERGGELVDSVAYSAERVTTMVEVYRYERGTITLAVVGNGDSCTVSCIWADCTNKTVEKASSNYTKDIKAADDIEKTDTDPTWEVAAFVDEYLSENA